MLGSYQKISVNNSQESSSASCTKKCDQKIFCFTEKFEVSKFSGFLQKKNFRAENIFDRIKPLSKFWWNGWGLSLPSKQASQELKNN